MSRQAFVTGASGFVVKAASTDELLDMYGKISNHGSLKGESREKIEAMSNLLREFRLAPVHQVTEERLKA